MQLIPWQPLHDIDDVFRRYLGSFSSQPTVPTASADANGVWAPSADISESKKEYLVKAVLPGVDKEDIHVDLKDNRLTISGTRENKNETKNETQHRVETFYGGFSRTFALPDDVDASKLSAECKKGVLSVHLPKIESEKPTASVNIPVA